MAHSHTSPPKPSFFPVAVLTFILVAVLWFFVAPAEGLLKNLALSGEDVRMICVCSILFLVFWKSLERCFLAPYQALYEKREASTVGAREHAQRLIKETQELTTQYETRVMDGRVKAMQEKLSKVGEVQKEVSAQIEKAQAEADQITTNGRSSLIKNLQSARERLSAEIDVMANLIVEKLRSGQHGGMR